jgi:hypothetical protein
MWAIVEVALGRLLADILRSEAVTGMTLYMAIKAEPARLAAIEAVAGRNLTAEDFAAYKTLQKSIRTTGRQRDLLMHNIWALPEDDSDCVVMLDARKLITHLSHASAYLASPWTGTPTEPLTTNTREAFWELLNSPLKYVEKDFEIIEERITALLGEVETFSERLQTQSRERANPKPLPSNAPKT